MLLGTDWGTHENVGAHLEHRQEPAGNTLPTWLENQNPKLFPLPRPLQ
jgi:hypothetical protein